MVEIYGKKATRYGFGEALVALGEADPRIFVLGADTVSSVAAHLFAEKYPQRFVNVGVAEQNLIGMAAGLAVAGYIPFAATYGIFASGRPWEQIRTTVCYSNLNVKIGGSHAGLMVGPDGATHQALEEIAIMRCLPRMTVLVPCDYEETRKATIAAASIDGPVYVRYGRETIPIITTPETPFVVGKALTMRPGDDVALIACGTMVFQALRAAEILALRGVSARVINLHTIKPLDEETIVTAARECRAVVTAEEHQIAGGLGSAVAEVLGRRMPVPIEMIGIHDSFGESGSPDELMKAFGLTGEEIAAAAARAVARARV